MNLERRDCISYSEDISGLPAEYRPKIFSNYSYENCLLECRLLYAKGKCGCLPYFYSTYFKNSSCNATGLECMAKIASKHDIFFNTAYNPT